MHPSNVVKNWKRSFKKNMKNVMARGLFLIKNHHFSLMRSLFGPSFSSENSGDGPMKENEGILDFLALPQNKDQEKKDAQNARRRQAYAQSKQAEGYEH